MGNPLAYLGLADYTLKRYRSWGGLRFLGCLKIWSWEPLPVGQLHTGEVRSRSLHSGSKPFPLMSRSLQERRPVVSPSGNWMNKIHPLLGSREDENQRLRFWCHTKKLRLYPEIYGGFWSSAWNLTSSWWGGWSDLGRTQERLLDSLGSVALIQEKDGKMLVGDKDHSVKPREQVTAQKEGNTGEHPSYTAQLPCFQNSTQGRHTTFHWGCVLSILIPIPAPQAYSAFRNSWIKEYEGVFKTNRSKLETWQCPADLFSLQWSESLSKQIASSTSEVSLCSNNIKQAKQVQTSVSLRARPVWVSETPPGHFLSS